MSKGTMLFNPFTGKPRHPEDILSDPQGTLVWDGEEPLRPAGAGLVTLFGETVLEHLEQGIKWLDERRDRLHHSGCSVHAPSAQCNCGLHRALSNLRAARNKLEEAAP